MYVTRHCSKLFRLFSFARNLPCQYCKSKPFRNEYLNTSLLEIRSLIQGYIAICIATPMHYPIIIQFLSDIAVHSKSNIYCDPTPAVYPGTFNRFFSFGVPFVFSWFFFPGTRHIGRRCEISIPVIEHQYAALHRAIVLIEYGTDSNPQK